MLDKALKCGARIDLHQSADQAGSTGVLLASAASAWHDRLPATAHPGVSSVSNRLSIGALVAQNAQLLRRVAQIAAIWTVSDAGYYFLLPALIYIE